MLSRVSSWPCRWVYNPDFNYPEKPHLFLEFHGTDNGVAEQVELLRSACEEYNVSNFQWASKAEERTRLWHARHNAYYACKSLHPTATGIVTDCCVPISMLAQCIARTQQLIAESGLIAPLVGHVGDGNFHLLILADRDVPEELDKALSLAASMNQIALEFGGTVSGEHGVGTGKKKYMLDEHGAAYGLMGVLKKAIDPNNIMNPGKLVTVN